MNRPATAVALAIGALCVLAACARDAGAQTLPDAPEPRARPAATVELPKRYADALVAWRTPEDIARFIDATFVYDRSRALALAEQPDARATRPAIHAPEAMFEKPQRRAESWQFVKSNWDELRKKFTPWGGAAIVRATGEFCDGKQRTDVQEFFATHPVEASDRSLKQALEKIDTCVELRTLQAQNFANWLRPEAVSK